MADYKRMVSYMYQYENGVKKKNVGYARVEVKNGQCKITLHMQLLGQLDSIFPTYLIQRDNDLQLIYLGDTVLKNQVMDSKLDAKEADIMDSGYGLSDMGGLLIFLNDKVFFATEWDDKPIVAEQVLEAMKPKPKKPITRVEEQGNTQQVKISEPEVAIQQPKRSEIEVAEENAELSLFEEMMIPKYKLPRGFKTIERLQNPYITNVSNIELDKLEVTDTIVDEKSQLKEALVETEVNVENQYPEVSYTDNQELMDSGITKTDTVMMDANESPSMEETELPDPSTAQHFFENYPRIYPFEDNEIIRCVKIEPKDIGMLPKEIWTFSNNSFLMHGFYCYHHLIFAKMKDRYGCNYILGIPGIYHSRERFMARMFGFENFKSIRKRELREGDFGYWYLVVSLG